MVHLGIFKNVFHIQVGILSSTLQSLSLCLLIFVETEVFLSKGTVLRLSHILNKRVFQWTNSHLSLK